MNFLHAAADTAETASGASDFKIALVGLGGVLVGAVLGLVGTWMTTRQNARLTKQAELRRLYADFFEALNEQSTMRIQDRIVDELLKPYEEATGTDSPTREQVDALGPDRAEGYMTLRESSKEANDRLLAAANRLEHLKYQARLLAPRDTSTAIDARVAIEQADAETAALLSEALVVLGRRDLSAGREHVAGMVRASRLKRESKFKVAMKDFEAYRKTTPA